MKNTMKCTHLSVLVQRQEKKFFIVLMQPGPAVIFYFNVNNRTVQLVFFH